MKYGKQAFECCRDRRIICPSVWRAYADVLESHASPSDDKDQRAKAESLCREVLPLCAPAHPLSAAIHRTLGFIMLRSFEATGTPAYLDEAMDLQQRALQLIIPSEAHKKHQHVRYLSMYLLTRRGHLGDSHDLDRAMALAEEAASSCPSLHVDRWKVSYLQIVCLYNKYFLSSKQAYLDEAIDLGRKACAVARLGDIPRPVLLGQMSDNILARYETFGSLGHDLTEAAELQREALGYIPPHSLHYSTRVRALAYILTQEFRQRGEMNILEEATLLYRQAMHALPRGNPEHSKCLYSLAGALALYFDETGDIDYLNDAISLDSQAIASIEPSHRYYHFAMARAISHLGTRYEALQTVNDLDNAISLSQKELNSTPIEHLNRRDAVMKLAGCLCLRGRHNNDIKDINEAIDKLTPYRSGLIQHMNGPDGLRTLAMAHLTRFRHTACSNDAVCALDIITELLDAIVPGHHERFDCLVSAAELYMEHGTPYRDLSIALRYIADGLADSSRDVRSRIRRVKRLLAIVESAHHEIIGAASLAPLELLGIYTATTAQLARIAFYGLHLRSRLQSLMVGQSIALNGASYALGLSLPDKALEILEQGRAVFWTHALRLRSPFDAVPGELRNRLLILARQLEMVDDLTHRPENPRLLEKEAAERRKKSEEFNELVEQVRCLPGLERFMLHDEYHTLSHAAKNGPVVVLVSSTLSCHAIVLKQSGDAVGISLSPLTDTWLTQTASEWHCAVSKARSIARNNRKMVKANKPSVLYNAKVKQILCYLWENIAWPVLSALGLEVRAYIRNV
jgi:tetratricopeptide (TPR) repeat protein